MKRKKIDKQTLITKYPPIEDFHNNKINNLINQKYQLNALYIKKKNLEEKLNILIKDDNAFNFENKYYKTTVKYDFNQFYPNKSKISLIDYSFPKSSLLLNIEDKLISIIKKEIDKYRINNVDKQELKNVLDNENGIEHFLKKINFNGYYNWENGTSFKKKYKNNNTFILNNDIKKMLSKYYSYKYEPTLAVITLEQDISKLNDDIKYIESNNHMYDYLLYTAEILSKYTELQQDNSSEYWDIVNEYYNIIDNMYDEVSSPEIKLLKQDLYQCLECKDKHDKNSIFYCSSCNSIHNSIVIEKYDNNIVCDKCGIILYDFNIITEVDDMSYTEKQNLYINNNFKYEKLEYFKDWLNDIQGISIKHGVTDSLIDTIGVELSKKIGDNIDPSDVNRDNIRKILKKIGKSKYYKAIPEIIYKITGIQPLKIPEDIRDKFIDMFKNIEYTFNTIISNGSLEIKQRKNFFSIPYVIYKFSELLGLNEYKEHIDLLKSDEKLAKQDIMWKEVMDVLHKKDPKLWVFIETI